ncbi:MAG: hypothetical protein ACP5O8_01325, partial [Candidatus Aenigmatarchaeota archaeon]
GYASGDTAYLKYKSISSWYNFQSLTSSETTYTFSNTSTSDLTPYYFIVEFGTSQTNTTVGTDYTYVDFVTIKGAMRFVPDIAFTILPDSRYFFTYLGKAANISHNYPNAKYDFSGNCTEFVYMNGTVSPYNIVYNHVGECAPPVEAIGYLEVGLEFPSSYTITQNQTFLLNATVFCRGGSCGDVYGTARYNASSPFPDTPINTTQGDKPFYVQEPPYPSQALKACPNNPLEEDEFCNLTWIINATGSVNSEWKVGVLFNSSLSQVQQNHTENSTISIVSGIESLSLSWSSIDFGFLVPNTPAENNPAPGNSQNLYNITNTGTCAPNLWIKGTDLINSTFNSFISVGNLSWSNSTNVYSPSTVYPLSHYYKLLYYSLPLNSNLTTYYWLSVPSVYAGIYKGTITICANCSTICD